MLKNPLATSSVSLGQHASHTLPQKIDAAARHGLQALEITYPDLEKYAASKSVDMVQAGSEIKDLCAAASLHVLSFASFQNYEGSPVPLEERLEIARQWIAITRALGAEHMQVPSSFDIKCNTDRKVIVSDLRHLADTAAEQQPAVKIAYENLGWSTHCTLWQEAVEIVQQVNRPNFGLCLDSFHLAVKLWADPYNKSGVQEGGEERLAESLRDYVKNCPLSKLFYVQLSDGEPVGTPYSTKHPWYDEALFVGHAWSNEARPFPLETEFGAYMPMVAFTQAMVVDIGFTGWVSLETFDRRMRKAEMGPEQNAERAMNSWKRLGRALQRGRPKTGKL